jgi:dTDP-4-dehydrorhamnose 3,5-epimerase-like enzyme
VNNDTTKTETLIMGVTCRPLIMHTDQRGWRAGIYRQDELAPEQFPVMAYIS